MPTEDQPDVSRTRFDEQAALDNLQRLQRELEESRQRRKDASAAFDNFVSSFRKPGETSRSASGDEARPLPSRLERPLFPPVPARRTKRVPRPGLLAGGLIAVAAAVLLARAWRGSPPEQPQAARPAVTSPAAARGANATVTAAAPTASPSTAPAELLAIRRVWIRVTVDGQRVAEREIDAGTRIPLRGRTIVVRAGDAGAVRIAMNGHDRGPLGPDGIVATRTFTTAAPVRP